MVYQVAGMTERSAAHLASIRLIIRMGFNVLPIIRLIVKTLEASGTVKLSLSFVYLDVHLQVGQPRKCFIANLTFNSMLLGFMQ